MEYWNNGMDDGMLEYWNNGILGRESKRKDVSHSSIVHFRPFRHLRHLRHLSAFKAFKGII